MSDRIQRAAAQTTEEDIDRLNTLLDQVRLDGMPARVVTQAKRAVLDGICAMVLGSGETDVPDIEAFLESSGEPEGDCTVVGRTVRRGFLAAGFANAALCQTHDANDGFAPDGSVGRLLHPGRIVIPAALAIGEWYGLTGQAFLELVIQGYEIGWRVVGLPNSDGRSAYIPSLLLGRVLGLSLEKLVNAVALALYHAPAFFKGRYTGKGLDDFSLAQGRSVRVGLESALLADAGFRCPSIEGHPGRNFTVDLDSALKAYAVERLYFKPYPACRSIHGAAEAAVRIARSNDFNCRDIESVTVELADQAMYTAIPIDMTSVNRITAAANPRYVTACALLDGEVRLQRFRDSALKDPAVFDLVSKIDVRENADFSSRYGHEGRPTRVTVRLCDGRTLSNDVAYAKGAPDNPLTDRELSEKLALYSPAGLSVSAQSDLIECIDRLEHLDTLSEVAGILRFSARMQQH